MSLTGNLGKCNSISLKVGKFIYECKCQHLMCTMWYDIMLF